MFADEEFGSDSSDDDYVPQELGDGGSEEDSGEEEDVNALLDEAGNDNSKPKKRAASKKKNAAPAGRKRTGGIKLDDAAAAEIAAAEQKENEEYKKKLEEDIKKEQEEKKETTEKKKSDDLWASFLADVPSHSKPKPKPTTSSGLGSLSSVLKPSSSTSSVKITPTVQPTTAKSEPTKAEKISITTDFDFAGEIVSVTKEVDAESKEAKQHLKTLEEDKSPTATAGPSLSGVKRPSGGLGGVLGRIGKKPKMGTLEKSRLDWNTFKEDKGIDDELKTHNRGKEGYIERQAFLQRTDVRQFEIERKIRMNSKR